MSASSIMPIHPVPESDAKACAFPPRPTHQVERRDDRPGCTNRSGPLARAASRHAYPRQLRELPPGCGSGAERTPRTPCRRHRRPLRVGANRTRSLAARHARSRSAPKPHRPTNGAWATRPGTGPRKRARSGSIGPGTTPRPWARPGRARDRVATTGEVAGRVSAQTMPGSGHRSSAPPHAPSAHASHDAPRHRCQALGNTPNANESS